MTIRRFVSGSSVILAGWLGVTFLNEVPSQRYPKLEKKSAAVDPVRGGMEVAAVPESP